MSQGLIRLNPNDNQWNRRIAPSVSEYVMELPLVIADAARHLSLHRLCRQNLSADVNDTALVKRQVLDKEVVDHKGILAELHLNSDPVLDVSCTNCGGTLASGTSGS